MKEIWKPISKDLYYIGSLIGDYEVSNKGRIRNAKTGKFIHPFTVSYTHLRAHETA